MKLRRRVHELLLWDLIHHRALIFNMHRDLLHGIRPAWRETLDNIPMQRNNETYPAGESRRSGLGLGFSSGCCAGRGVLSWLRSSRPRRQLTEEPPEEGFWRGAPPLSASTNQDSDFASSSKELTQGEFEVFFPEGKRKRRKRGEARASESPSCSSIMFSRSSSVERETRESRSSDGSWYLMEKEWLCKKERERREWRSDKVCRRSTVIIRVSPPR